MTAATDTQAGLLRAILADPADDAARLVYADWLEENGRPEHAAFVRGQCADPAAAVVYWRCPCGCNQLVGTSDHGSMGVLRAFEHTVLGPVGPAMQATGDRVQRAAARRGFVTEVRLPLQAFMSEAVRLFLHAPVTAVVLTDRGPSLSIGWSLWYRQQINDHPDFLPPALFDRLAGHEPWPPHATERAKAYRSWPAALAALSAVCVAHGRALAGLPPLPGD